MVAVVAISENILIYQVDHQEVLGHYSVPHSSLIPRVPNTIPQGPHKRNFCPVSLILEKNAIVPIIGIGH